MGKLRRLTRSMLIEILKKKLTNKRETWFEEMPRVLWAYNTTRKTSMGMTPFTLNYEPVTLIPEEIEILTYKAQQFHERLNNEGLKQSFDLLDEKGRELRLER